MMTKTDFRRMCRCIEKTGHFIVKDDGKCTWTEVEKLGPYEYAAYNCGRCFRDCFAVESSMSKMEYMFVD